MLTLCKYRFLIVASLVLLLSGCGTTTNIKRDTPHEPSVASKNLKFESISVKVRTEVADTGEEARLLENYLRKQFVAKNKKVVDSDPDAEMIAVIKHLKKVSRGARLWWGSLAGKSEIRVDVSMRTRKSEPVHFTVDSEAKGASSAGDWFTGYGGTTEDIIQRTSVAIAAELL